MNFLKNIKLNIFGGLSLYEIINLYFKGLTEGAITTRAAAIAFSFTMALFPFAIFILTLLANVPFLEDTLWELLKNILPPNSYDEVHSYVVNEIFADKDISVLSFSFGLVTILATNGMNAMLSAFEYSYHKLDTRNIINQYIIAFVLTLTITVLFILLLYILFEIETARIVFENSKFYSTNGSIAFTFLRYLVAVIVLLTSFLIIYYVGIKGKKSLIFVFPGALLSAFLIILTSYFFGLYIINFSSYNKLYGSIGTMIMLMLWIYLNCIATIVGFELNATIFSTNNSTNKPKQ